MARVREDINRAIMRAVWALVIFAGAIFALNWQFSIAMLDQDAKIQSLLIQEQLLFDIEGEILSIDLIKSDSLLNSSLQMLKSIDDKLVEFDQVGLNTDVFDKSYGQFKVDFRSASSQGQSAEVYRSLLTTFAQEVRDIRKSFSSDIRDMLSSHQKAGAINQLVVSVLSMILTLVVVIPVVRKVKSLGVQIEDIYVELVSTNEELTRSKDSLASHVLEVETQRQAMSQRQNDLEEALDHAENQKAMHDHASRRFQSLFKGLPVGSMTFDETGTIMEWNPMMSVLFGIEIHMALLNPVCTTLGSDGRESELAGLVTRVAERGEQLEFDWTYWVDDEERTVSMVWFPLKDPKGNPVGGIGCAVDVTEHRENQRLVASMYQMQRAVLDSADYAIISSSPDGSITGFNRAAEALFGYSHEEAIGGLNIVELHSEVEIELLSAEIEESNGDFATGIDALCYRAIRGETDEGEWSLSRKDGTHFDVRLSITALQDEGGDIQGFVLIGKDITEEKLIQERLRMLSMVAQEARNSVVICDSASRIRYANPAFEELTGWTAAESIGRMPFEFLFGENTDEDTREVLKKAVMSQTAVSCDILQYNKLGETHWVRSSLTPVIDEKGAFRNLVWIQEDVSERKAAEERIVAANERTTQILESIRDNFFSVDAAGLIRYANRTAARILGQLPDVLVGQSVWSVCKGVDWAPVKEPVKNAVSSGQPSVLESFFTGLGTYFEFRIYPSADGASVFFQDITERKNFQNRLHEQMAQLEEAKCQLEVNQSELQAANKKLHGLASTDGLTGLSNHMSFQEFLQESIDKAQEHGTSVAVAMMDVDKFKMYNDNFGHQAGDEVLRGVADVLRQTVKSPHLAARYGGEEFVIVMIGLDEVEALSLVEECRWELEGKSWPNREVTASFGVSFWNPEITDRQVLLEMADMALYVSKNGGRNRVTASNWMPAEDTNQSETAA